MLASAWYHTRCSRHVITALWHNPLYIITQTSCARMSVLNMTFACLFVCLLNSVFASFPLCLLFHSITFHQKCVKTITHWAFSIDSKWSDWWRRITARQTCLFDSPFSNRPQSHDSILCHGIAGGETRWMLHTCPFIFAANLSISKHVLLMLSNMLHACSPMLFLKSTSHAISVFFPLLSNRQKSFIEQSDKANIGKPRLTRVLFRF